MQHKQPAIVFVNENVRGICLSAPHLIAVRGGDAFEASDPCRLSLDLDGDFRDIDEHESGVTEALFPAVPDIFPAGKPGPIRMDTDGAGIRCPHLIHQIDIEAFESEIELEVGFNELLRIGHKESSFITSLDPHATCNIDYYLPGVRVHVPDCQCPGRCNISSFVKLRRCICGYLKPLRHRDGLVR